MLQISLFAAIVLSVVSACPLKAQPDARKADNEAGRAIEYMNSNLPESAIEAWNRAILSMPTYLPYRYEKAVSLVMAKRYQDAVVELQSIYTDTSLQDRGYQLLGNCYDMLEDTVRSRAYYREGLLAFPKSGRLHFEMGQQYFLDRKIDVANDWWLRGSRAEPAFATNYYWLARSYAETKDRIWAVFFGEVFLNIERHTSRTRDISRLLYDVWNRSMKLGDSLDPINFCSDELLEIPDSRGSATLAFPVAFEYTIATSAQPFIPKDSVLRVLSIEKLVDLRYRFMRSWYALGYEVKHPNVLLAWNKRLQDQGRLKEYLWWLYGYGDKAEMSRYYKKNGDRYDTFLVWFSENGMSFEQPLCLGLGCQ